MERLLRDRLPEGRFIGVTPERSRLMAAVRDKGNKTTERRLRMALVRARIGGWGLAPRTIRGKPDFYFERERVAVFVDGCFWHGCQTCGHVPATNSAFWAAKIERNRERDAATTAALSAAGLRTLRFWEHELRDGLGVCVAAVKALVGERAGRPFEGHRVPDEARRGGGDDAP